MSTKSSIVAIDPNHNIAVTASAGTGKTYLLVSRIIRLLIHGVLPDNILAITFTRKAAGEMRQRLYERLWTLATADKVDLELLLINLGVAKNTGNQNLAKNLYERVLMADRPIRILTFHAFCQELLQRFPLEAKIPPGFELLETTAIFQQHAWDQMLVEATNNPEASLAESLEILFTACNGLHNTKESLLNGFLEHRSDWWAYTENQSDPVLYANGQLSLTLSDQSFSFQKFISTQEKNIRDYIYYLQKFKNKTADKNIASLEKCLQCDDPENAFNILQSVYLNDKYQIRNYRFNKKALDASSSEHFLKLHNEIAEGVLAAREIVLQNNAFKANKAWYFAGQCLLDYYQTIKLEQGVLDFSDLEWKSYQLLHKSENALWVQYKLDQKIDHLLIDEFQDTNPTQWQLILPLLQEIASSEQNELKSVFIVGDPKQSIYSFRRANPELQATANDWLVKNLNAKKITLNHSWRSSPAVIEAINRIFDDHNNEYKFEEFERHGTHLDKLWGKVEIVPLADLKSSTQAETVKYVPSADVNTTAQSENRLRNPLLEQRSTAENSAYYLEGITIANKIHELINQKIGLKFSDILILFRNRNHVGHFEKALSDKQIPFLGTERGALLESLEISDLEALLNFLVTPYNNLALSHTLRSPIFSVDDNDLITLASNDQFPSWYERLQQLNDLDKLSPALKHAHQLLSHWLTQTGHLPVHDLLDKIYNDADVIQRYHSATPSNMRAQTIANLHYFLELSLNIDSGRYPSIMKFLTYLKKIRISIGDKPDSPPAGGDENRVSLMTIHAAKGLEAPVVFLADAGAITLNNTSYKPIIDWPSNAQNPKHFFLATTKNNLPAAFNGILDKRNHILQRENLNLLYVALSRAKNILFISASRTTKVNKTSWYYKIKSILQAYANDKDSIQFTFEKPSTVKDQPIASNNKYAEIDERLFQPIKNRDNNTTIKPSEIDYTTAPEDHNHSTSNSATIRGLIIHDYLNKLTQYDTSTASENLYSIHEVSKNSKTIEQYKQEALNVFKQSEFAFLFDNKLYKKAYNEVPIHYQIDNHQVNGVIDRLVTTDDCVWIIDYKTNTEVELGSVDDTAESYRKQLTFYASGVEKIWKDKKIRAGIIFTAGPYFYELKL